MNHKEKIIRCNNLLKKWNAGNFDGTDLHRFANIIQSFALFFINSLLIVHKSYPVSLLLLWFRQESSE